MTTEEILSTQIPEFTEDAPTSQAPVEKKREVIETPSVVEVQDRQPSEAAQYHGAQLQHKIGGHADVDKDEEKRIVNEMHLSKVGETIGKNADIRDGWMDVDRALLGDRSIYYPEDWRFRIRPATVEAIRNWSTIDDENPNSVDDVFNEILKSCLSIITPAGPLPWGNIRSWDRLFFVLLIREYTFIKGETNIKYEEDCPNCDNAVTFTLTSQTLMYDYPDPEVMRYFSQEDQVWYINPNDYDVEWPEPITLYLPTLEKDANIKAWVINKLQQNRNAKIDSVFIRFLIWLAPKISKDLTIAQRQIRDYEIKFKSWDEEMFSFMDEVLRNIIVTPSTKLITNCPTCGEEVTSEIRFPDGISSLFNVQRRSRKFGKK